MKQLILVFIIFALVCSVSAQDIVTNKNKVDIRTWTGEMQYHPEGLNSVTIETKINGERFQANDINKPGAASVRYASPEKVYFIFPDPKVQQEYQIFENGTIEETLFLKEHNDIVWNVELSGNDYLQATSDGGFKIVNPNVNEKENGYVYISKPSGWDANGVHISYTFEMGKDGSSLTLVDPQGHKNDNHDNIAYPVVVDPLIAHRYDLKLLMHGNYETDSATPTQDYRDSSRYLRVGAVASGTANSGNTTKLLGNGSYFVMNGNITIPDSPDFTLGTNNWSWSFSIFEPYANYNTTELGQFVDTNNYDRVRIVATSGPVFTSVRGGATIATCSGPALKAPGWSNITVIMNGSSCTAYVNGTSTGAGAARTGSLTDLSAPFLISSLSSSGSASSVNIDEIKIFNGGFAMAINEIDGIEYPLYLNASIGGANLGYADDNSTVSLLHFNGANGGTVFTDQVANRTWTRIGSTPVTSTNWAKFGPSSYYAESLEYIKTPATPNFDFGSGNWTVDFWLRYTAASVTPSPFYASSGSVGYSIKLDTSGTGSIMLLSNNSGSFTNDAVAPLNSALSVPMHIVVERDANNIKIFKDGTLISNTAIPSTYRYNTYGGLSGDVIVQGSSTYYDELRISKGIARWATNFTPPSYAYELTLPSFTATPAALVNVGPSVQFNDTTPDSKWTQIGYYWDFGDGTNSVLQNPSHVYSNVGVYNVTLNTLNNNMTASVAQVYKVGAPVVDFACSPLTGTAALQVTCQDLTTNATPITSRLIDFGDGTTSTADPPWNHVYSTFGAFSVNLTETNSIGSGFNYKRDYIVTSTNQNQQQTWYTPKSVLFNVYDSKYNKVVGAFVNITPDVSTFPDGTNWLVDMYGIRPDVANQMLNGTLLMSGTTKSNGAITFTMLSSIGYNIAVTNPANGIIQTTNVTPIDPYYNINLVGSATNNTYVDMGYNTSLYITEPDIRNVTMNLAYQDISARTTLLEFYVLARINNTVINYQSATGFGSNIVLMNYTVPNIRPDQYSWYYNAMRVK